MEVRMSERLFPMPAHTLVLVLVWLLLNDFTAGHLVLGSLLGIGIPWLVAPLSDRHPRMRKPLRVLRYLGIVLYDIIVSNFQVAVRILQPNHRLRPGLIALPLDLSEQFPLAILASTISLTPGTVSIDFSDDLKWLYIHALHVDDEQAMIRHIKRRYEAPLREIFAC
jgi:multicomponent K+:H+ antiporter subunit E